jgi:hypothetical protein
MQLFSPALTLFTLFIGELTQVITESKFNENEFKHKLNNLEKFLRFYEFDAEDKAKIVDQVGECSIVLVI